MSASSCFAFSTFREIGKQSEDTAAQIDLQKWELHIWPTDFILYRVDSSQLIAWAPVKYCLVHWGLSCFPAFINNNIQANINKSTAQGKSNAKT